MYQYSGNNKEKSSIERYRGGRVLRGKGPLLALFPFVSSNSPGFEEDLQVRVHGEKSIRNQKNQEDHHRPSLIESMMLPPDQLLIVSAMRAEESA
jgi:hypothetical protein